MLTTGNDEYIQRTIIDGDSLGSVVTIPAGSDNRTVVSGLTIQNGGRTRYDCGIVCNGSSPILEYLIVRNCGGGNNGAGIYQSGNGAEVRYCTLTGNLRGVYSS